MECLHNRYSKKRWLLSWIIKGGGKMRKKGYLLGCVVLLLVLQPLIQVKGSQVHSVETDGSIGFTGTYEPIGTPDPKPPEQIVKPPLTETNPGGSLPQTNTVTQSWLLWVGLNLVGFVVYQRNKNKQHKK